MFRTALISLCLTSTALATTWTVDDDGKADFDNIQAAVDAASDGDEIVVYPGTYTSTQDGHVVNMLGKAVTLRSSDPSDPDVVAATIIDGKNTRRGLACFNQETSNTIISGFTITNGFSVEFDYNQDGGIGWEENGGGGIYNWTDSNPTIQYCIFSQNTSQGSGGGMYNYQFSNPTIVDCLFKNNVASSGGAIFNYNNTPTLTRCIFEHNLATNRGGGMWNASSSPTITDCILTNNSAAAGGGGLCCSHEGHPGNSILIDTIICGNFPDQIFGSWTDGGGVCVAYNCQDNDGDGLPDKCTQSSGNVHLVPKEYGTIQEAINTAVSGDEIIIAPGIYTGDGLWVMNTMGKRLLIHSSGGPDVTFIDGEDKRRCLQCTGGETSETIIKGLTITRGNADIGSGLYAAYGSNPSIENCNFTNNSAGEGGGLMLIASSPQLVDCFFINNSGYGGGINCNFLSSPTFTNCMIIGNSGGGMYNFGSSPTLTNCTFENNTDYGQGGGGGGMGNYLNSSPTLTNCTFTGNTAEWGSGMHNIESNPTLTDCTFTSNIADNSLGGGMYNYISNPTLTDTTVCGNSPDQIIGDWTDNGGNLVADECPLECPDINGDGYVDVSDLLVVIDQWGATKSLADLNFDGIVDVTDLLIVVGNWGPCP